MRSFDVPPHFRSPIIAKIKAKRKLEDPRKQDFSPARVNLGKLQLIIPRHFGFCYGVENAIEKSYRAINEHPDKQIYLLSQMIHNPIVNQDLEENGLRFLQDTEGNELMDWSVLNENDIVIIPAFGTTLETEERLKQIGVEIEKYNTTCPFVEKVWNRSAKLGEMDYSVIIHGKAKHEETKATFSHTVKNAASLIILNMDEAIFLGEFIRGNVSRAELLTQFQGNYSIDFDPDIHLQRIGVVNQTTMLASETQDIADYLKSVLIEKYGEADIKKHYADTRDTLCYATNDNQTSTLSLLNEEADIAIVVGGYNSSNTTHLVEILEQKFPTIFIKDAEEIKAIDSVSSFNIHKKEMELRSDFFPQTANPKVIITSGASCPDSTVEEVIQQVLKIYQEDFNPEDFDF